MSPSYQLGDVILGSYSSIAVFATLLCAAWAGMRGRRLGLEPRSVVAAGLSVAIVGLLGARLWSSLFEVPDPSPSIVDRLWSQGGLSILGGLALGVPAAMLAARALGISSMRLADLFSAPVALGIGLGRVGCLMAGCCHGYPTTCPVGIVYPDFAAPVRPIGVPLHPIPIYEAALCFALAAFLARRQARTPGESFAILLTVYGLGRTFIEPFRADHRGVFAGWPTTQLASVLLAAGGAALWISLHVNASRAARLSESSLTHSTKASS